LREYLREKREKEKESKGKGKKMSKIFKFSENQIGDMKLKRLNRGGILIP